MNNEQLQQWIEQISLSYFGVPFKHCATFNSRLRSTGGRYFLKSHHIEINPHQLANYGHEEVEKIIKHELCHYHLHLAGKGYQHRDEEFKSLLERVQGSRYCKALPQAKRSKSLPFRYKLICKSCGMIYLRKRRMDVSRYRCGKCRGKLAYIEGL